MGRRKLSVNESKSELITIRATEEEKKLLIIQSHWRKKNEMKVSEYILNKIIE